MQFKSAFIYHLCFAVLSILHHRDDEQRTDKGEKNKNDTHNFLSATIGSYFQNKATVHFCPIGGYTSTS